VFAVVIVLRYLVPTIVVHSKKPASSFCYHGRFCGLQKAQQLSSLKDCNLCCRGELAFYFLIGCPQRPYSKLVYSNSMFLATTTSNMYMKYVHVHLYQVVLAGSSMKARKIAKASSPLQRGVDIGHVLVFGALERCFHYFFAKNWRASGFLRANSEFQRSSLRQARVPVVPGTPEGHAACRHIGWSIEQKPPTPSNK
jgi:hypothetical protein